jgi:macrolide-specific efflux system membrane fusion protein
VSGQLEKLFVQVGDVVKPQQPVARIDPAQLQAKVDAGRAGLRQLRAQLQEKLAQAQLAETQHERNKMLMAREFIAPMALQTSVAAVASARSQVGALQAQIEQGQAQLTGDEAALRTARILAPMAGSVVSIQVREGQTVVASQSAPVLMRIADLSRMTVWAQVSEADVPAIRVGMPAEFSTIGLPERRWRGAVRQIMPTPELVNSVVLYNVLFDVDNPDGALRPQMSAQVSFLRARSEDALVVPVQALERKPRTATAKAEDAAPEDRRAPKPGKGYLVQVLGPEGQPEARKVRIGMQSGGWAEVLAGLQEGETVVVDAPAQAGSARKGSKAAPPKTGKATAGAGSARLL